MANISLSDPASLINHSCECETFSSDLEVEDFIDGALSKLKALVHVALKNGLHECSIGSQYNYWLLIDEQVSQISLGFEKLFAVSQ